MNITPETIAGSAGILISLALSHVPGLRDTWDGLSAEWKRLWTLMSMVAVVLGVVAGSCMGLIAGPACSVAGVPSLLSVMAAAVVGNQTAYVFAARGRQERTRNIRLRGIDQTRSPNVLGR